MNYWAPENKIILGPAELHPFYCHSHIHIFYLTAEIIDFSLSDNDTQLYTKTLSLLSLASVTYSLVVIQEHAK